MPSHSDTPRAAHSKIRRSARGRRPAQPAMPLLFHRDENGGVARIPLKIAFRLSRLKPAPGLFCDGCPFGQVSIAADHRLISETNLGEASIPLRRKSRDHLINAFRRLS